MQAQTNVDTTRNHLEDGRTRQIVGVCGRAGWSQSSSAREFNVSCSVVSRLMIEGRHYLQETTGVNVSHRTAFERWMSSGIISYRLAFVPIINDRNRDARLTWCSDHRSWSVAQWKNVPFSDESRFCLRFRDWRQRISREKNTHSEPSHVCSIDRTSTEPHSSFCDL